MYGHGEASMYDIETSNVIQYVWLGFKKPQLRVLIRG